MISGVCGALATRAGIPVWVVRVIALIMFVSHPPVMLLVYFGCAIWLHGRNRGTWRSMATRYREPAPGYGAAAPRASAWPSGAGQAGSAAPGYNDSVSDRFNRLDRRLASLEQAVMDRENGLRRAFRDLDS